MRSTSKPGTAVRSTPKIRSRWLWRLNPGELGGVATGRLRGSGWPTVLTLKSFDALLNFLVAVGNELLVVTVSGEGLFEREDMLRTIVTNQAFGNGFNGSFDAVVAQFG